MARLRLVPVEPQDALLDGCEAQLASVMGHILRTRGLAELQTMICQQTRALTKAHRGQLEREGWVV